ncbi:hypothetical protein C8J57DRAFT_1225801 [Mycena rebaudengoi]|nr:hypothetical protein C8J57DRAFT_1225801 [Mycena rebaudengoi]
MREVMKKGDREGDAGNTGGEGTEWYFLSKQKSTQQTTGASAASGRGDAETRKKEDEYETRATRSALIARPTTRACPSEGVLDPGALRRVSQAQYASKHCGIRVSKEHRDATTRKKKNRRRRKGKENPAPPTTAAPPDALSAFCASRCAYAFVGFAKYAAAGVMSEGRGARRAWGGKGAAVYRREGRGGACATKKRKRGMWLGCVAVGMCCCGEGGQVGHDR